MARNLRTAKARESLPPELLDQIKAVFDVIGPYIGMTLEQFEVGCICFFINGNALAGVWKDRLIARVGSDEGEAALREPHVRAFDITGRPMRKPIPFDLIERLVKLRVKQDTEKATAKKKKR